MANVELPRTLTDLSSAFKQKSYKDIIKLCQNPGNLSPSQLAIWKYSGGALLAGRPLDSVIIFMAGSSGAGKSSTINVLFDDRNLCPTSASRSETKDPVMLQKQLCITREVPPVVGRLSFVDVPGTFDTNHKNEVVNLASIRKFKEGSVELTSRKELCSLVERKVLGIRATVYPNLVMFVVKVSDNRMTGPDSFFRKSLEAFKNTADLIDLKHPNLIIVLTHAMALPRKKDRFISQLNEKINQIRATVAEVLKISDVDVVPVENEGEDYDLEMDGDFYKLPNGELSHSNLFQAMLRRFDKNNDLLGRLLTGWYFSGNCPERQHSAEVINTHVKLNPTELAQAGLDLKNLNISVSDEFIVPIYNFQSLGYGYCPVTEEIKPVSLLGGAASPEFKVVEVDSAKFLIPKCVSAFVKKTSRFHRITFFEKEEYQSHMRASYGIEAGFKLIVQASSEGRWINNGTGASSSSVISMVQEIQVATFKVENPKEQVKCPKFFQELENLPEEYSDSTRSHFRSFFSNWGSHVVIEQAIGGAVQLNCTIQQTSFSRDNLQAIEAKVAAMFKGLTLGAHGGHALQNQGLGGVGVSNEHLQIDGGDPPALVTLDTLNTPELKQWAITVPEKPAELRRSIKLYPYYNFLKSGPRCESLREATTEYLSNTLNARIEAAYESSRQKASEDAVNAAVKAPPSNNCFPRGTMIKLIDGRQTPIEELGQCDAKLMTVGLKNQKLFGIEAMIPGKASITTFCTFLDQKPDELVEYLVIEFDNGRKLTVSEGHMIFQSLPGGLVKGKQAKHFKIGEMAVYSDGEQGGFETPTITRIGKEILVGAFSPLTMSGTFIADGFLVSSYANTDSFNVAQVALFPLKMWRKLVTKKGKYSDANKEKGQKVVVSEGIHPFAKFLMTFRKTLTSVAPGHNN